MSDKELLRAMLLRTGQEPVINRVVQPDSCQDLVLYVRDLSGITVPAENKEDAGQSGRKNHF